MCSVGRYWGGIWDLRNLDIQMHISSAETESYLLEVAGLFLVLFPSAHLQVSPSLKQLWGFDPGRQAERLVEWGKIPMAMFFPISLVSTRGVDWRKIIMQLKNDKQEDRKLQWLPCDGSTDVIGNTKTVAPLSMSVNSCPWTDMSCEMIGKCDLLWEAERHHYLSVCWQKDSNCSLPQPE